MTIRVSRADFEMVTAPDEDHDASYLEQEGFEERLAEYRRGVFSYVGVRARVEIKIPAGGGGHILHEVASPGVWGIEDDSDDEYLKEVFEEECSVLEDMLRALSAVEVAGPEAGKAVGS